MTAEVILICRIRTRCD